jgi:hypothetical protein
VVHRLQEDQLRIYAAAPTMQLLTKYGLFAFRYYDKFGVARLPRPNS